MKRKSDYVIPGIYLIILVIVLGCFLVLTPWKKSDRTSVVADTTTCTTTTTTTMSTTTTTTLTTTVTTTTETTTTTTATTYDFKERLIDYGYFTGTYYHGEYTNPCPGGSGRMLEDCTPKSNDTKGSVACKRIQSEYGYNVNGRTRVYLEIDGYPDMNGWYWVDDACESYSVVDFYFINYSSCPWENDGLSRVHLWMEVS